MACKHMRKLLVVIVMMCLVACDGTQYEYSRRPCYVVIDNSKHLDATLASAMNTMAPGIFCMIRQTQKNGATYFSVSSNQNMSSEILLNGIDMNISRIVGLNNGIIVGFGNLDNPATFYAYDRECPNCFDPDAIPMRSKPLSMDEKGHAICGICNRSYDMNNRGYIISGEKGKPLTRFPATTSGPFGTLVVQ